MRRLAILFTAALAVPPPSAARAADLVVEVAGVRNDRGEIRLALFAEGDFLDFRRVQARAQQPARPGRVTLRLNGLPEGRYSFAIAHDENGNGRGDRNFLGIPTEGVAISNNAKGTFGPPDEAAARFALSSSGLRQTITLTYY